MRAGIDINRYVAMARNIIEDDRADDDDDDELHDNPIPNLSNAVKIIETDPKFKGFVWYDEFLRKMMTGNPPREWSDADDLYLTIRFQREKKIPKMSRETVTQAVIATAFKKENVKNCVTDWLNSLTWDNVARVDHFFEDHFGANGTVYTRAASRNFWISMVARVYQPGCQADNMIVLEGTQGIRKSSALRVIGGEWFSEQHESITGKGFFEVLQGKLLIEVSEMDSFNRAEVTRVKQVITCTSDRFRESYGRHAKDHPRRCIFVGTTNRNDWNRDETGARRFWPISCHGDIDIDAIRAGRTQLFAEAVHLYKSGQTWWEMPDETRAEQEKRYTEDVWSELIEDHIRPKSKVTVLEILVDCLKFDNARIQKSDQMRVATCLRRLGWEKGKNERIGTSQVRFWTQKTT
jgi:predicted P-loop ATPase